MGLPPVMFSHREKLVPLLDILLGNTSVLIDRDPHAAERRKVYGRAGEYRLPKHGLEYRTLSNFWLRAYPLMHGMMGLARLGLDILTAEEIALEGGGWGAVKRLTELVSIDKVRTAINENNLDLAKENYAGVRKFIEDHVSDDASTLSRGLQAGYLPAFDFFIEMIDRKGIEYWFPDDPMTYWTSVFTEGHETGFEAFMTGKVADKMRQKQIEGDVGRLGQQIRAKVAKSVGISI